MKRIFYIVILLTLAGCSSIRIPSYIQEKNPFNHRFYAGYSRVKPACQQALTDMGWTVQKEMSPQVFEVNSEDENQTQSILLVTKVRQTRLFLGTRYARMNIYIHSRADVSDVQVRYLVVNDFFLMKPKVFGSISLAKRFFERVQANLGN